MLRNNKSMESLNENNHSTKCVLSSLQLVLESENIVHYDEIQFKSTCATCCGPTIVSVAPILTPLFSRNILDGHLYCILHLLFPSFQSL